MLQGQLFLNLFFPFGRQVSAPVLVCSTDIEDNLKASFRKALKKKTESKLDESSFLTVFHQIGTTYMNGVFTLYFEIEGNMLSQVEQWLQIQHAIL